LEEERVSCVFFHLQGMSQGATFWQYIGQSTAAIMLP